MAEVKLINVSKIFPRGNVGVKDATFEVADGEFCVILGPSGCGKTTTLRLIAGLEYPTEGEIYIGGKLVNNVEPKDREIAMVFQNYALYPHMTVYDNMAFGLKMRKVPKEEIHNRILEAAELLDIKNLLDRKPRELSGGQRQRVAVGRVIVRHPKVFLFDEPLSNLDAKMRTKMRAELARIHRQLKTTTIYVTHDQVEAMTLGQKIVLMKDGEIQQIGTPLSIYDYPINKFVAGFIGSPPMNFFDGEIVEEDGKLVFNFQLGKYVLPQEIAKKVKEVGKSKKAILGVRPEEIILGEGDFPAQIDFFELLGNETIVYLDAGDTTLNVRAQSSFNYEPGSKVVFKFSDRGHLFDKDTEVSLLK
ncbi:MAG TPA: sn-glycerol-3-phosphate ABC transporter ATP-binding protein UgpC [Candidatus Hydrothermia bacterium]|nr:sn-glycerol-3-phosphate ABC transporter ATP-binding protein UgpC [Candidatus Hydrothermia bacterium]